MLRQACSAGRVLHSTEPSNAQQRVVPLGFERRVQDKTQVHACFMLRRCWKVPPLCTSEPQ